MDTIPVNSTVPVTSTLSGGMLSDTCSLLLREECCDEFLLKFNLLHTECLKHALSKGIGYGIVAAATLVKVPQVLKILSAKSGVGISLFGVTLELLAITFNAAYSFRKGYPFSAWGEIPFLLVETAMCLLLVLWFEKQYSGVMISFFAIMGVIYVLCSSITPTHILWSLQACNLPLAVTGKMIQGYKNWSAGHTGQMSAVTVWCLFLGCVARVFTSIQETGDQLVIVTFAVAALANSILVAQVHYYWNATEKFLKKQKTLKKE